MDIKPGYMLGAKPRHQAIGHVLGILAGATAAVPIFFFVFVPDHPSTEMATEEYPFVAAQIWHGIAELLTRGLDHLPVSARWAALIGALVGITLEGIKTATKGKFWLSGVGIGLAFVIPFSTCLAMFAGAFFFWVMAKRYEKKEDAWAKRVFVDNLEPICAGVIAGGALTGILVIVLENFVLS